MFSVWPPVIPRSLENRREGFSFHCRTTEYESTECMSSGRMVKIISENSARQTAWSMGSLDDSVASRRQGLGHRILDLRFSQYVCRFLCIRNVSPSSHLSSSQGSQDPKIRRIRRYTRYVRVGKNLERQIQFKRQQGSRISRKRYTLNVASEP